MSSAALSHALLDVLARRQSPVHRLNPRAKLVVTVAFLVAVLAHPRYAVVQLLPFFAFPLLFWAASGLPAAPLLKRLLWLSPFAVMVGAFNPLLDTTPVALGPWQMAAGWLSFTSIVLRFTLAVGTLLLLVATTGVAPLARAAGDLGVPRVLVVQILLLHRYIYLLAEEGQRLLQAYALRAGRCRPDWRGAAGFIGQLLVRALDRAQRVHQAMACRGFDGELRLLAPARMRTTDWWFLASAVAACALLWAVNPAAWLGHWVLGGVG